MSPLDEQIAAEICEWWEIERYVDVGAVLVIQIEQTAEQIRRKERNQYLRQRVVVEEKHVLRAKQITAEKDVLPRDPCGPRGPCGDDRDGGTK